MKKLILAALLAAFATGTVQAQKVCGKDFCTLPLKPHTEAQAELYAADRCKTVFHLTPDDKDYEICTKQKKWEFLQRRR